MLARKTPPPSVSAVARVVIKGAADTAYDSDAAAYFARLPSQPADDWKAAANTLVTGLKADGLYSLLTGLYVFAVEAPDQELPNVVSGDFTLTRHGTTNLTPRSGMQSDGASGYYDTGLAFTEGMQIAFSFGAFVAASASGVPSLTGTVGAASMVIDCVSTSNGTTASMRLGMTNTLSWANTVPTGHFAVTRGSGTVTGYQDGTQKASISAANFVLSGDSILWMRRGSICTTARLAIGWLAEATLSGTQMANLHARLSAFLAAIA